jgi:hypothetical protein
MGFPCYSLPDFLVVPNVIVTSGPPLLEINCLVLGETHNHIFPVKIAGTESVGALKDAIKEKKRPAFDHVPADTLVLWKVSLPFDDSLEEIVKNFDGGEPLSPVDKLSNVLSNVDETDLHIVVKGPSIAENEVPPVSLASLLKGRQRFSAALPRTPPSSLGMPSNFSKFQEKQNPIACGRPPAADAPIPVTLLHPIFRQFLDNCENHQPIAEDNMLVLELMGAMSSFFRGEDTRAAELRDILTRHGIPVATSTITSKGHYFRTDGAVAINGHLVAIIEVKEEIGSRGAEPYAQVVLYYSHSTAAKSQEFPKFNFPSLLITVFGQTLLSSLAI